MFFNLWKGEFPPPKRGGGLRALYGNNLPDETFCVLQGKEMKLYGEWRMRRLALEKWDGMEGEG